MLAHHGQDQVETVLMRMFQGRGMLPMRRHGPLGPGLFVRPFLAQHKSRLVDYLRAHHVAWVDDPSNSDTMLDRNFLRTQVLPQVRQRWPSSCSRGAAIRGRSIGPAGAVDALCGQAGDEVLLSADSSGHRACRCLVARVLGPSRPIWCFRRCITRVAAPAAGSDRGYPDLGSACLRIWQDKLYFEPVSESGEKGLSEISATVPMQVLWNKYKLDLAPATAGEVDAVAYVGGLRVTRRDSLNALPAGVADRLKRRFQLAGIPPWRRGQYPCCGTTSGCFVFRRFGSAPIHNCQLSRPASIAWSEVRPAVTELIR